MTRKTSPETLPELLRAGDLARLLQCSISTVGNMRHRGDLPESFKLGNARYWRRADVLAWLDRCATTSPAEVAL
jgi:predicted DNA-binding transcriptional regulator AlpA